MTCSICLRFSVAVISRVCCGCWHRERDCTCIPTAPERSRLQPEETPHGND